jgi:hypothetical protein
MNWLFRLIRFITAFKAHTIRLSRYFRGAVLVYLSEQDEEG